MAVCDTSGKDRNNHGVSIPFGAFCAWSVLFTCVVFFSWFFRRVRPWKEEEAVPAWCRSVNSVQGKILLVGKIFYICVSLWHHHLSESRTHPLLLSDILGDTITPYNVRSHCIPLFWNHHLFVLYQCEFLHIRLISWALKKSPYMYIWNESDDEL